MNILFTCGSYSWGGLEMQSLKLAISFRDKGHHVLLCVPHDSILQKKAIEAQISVATLHWKNINTVRNIFRFKTIIKTFRPRIVHAQLSHDLWALSPALSGNRNIALILTRRMASGHRKKDIFHRMLYKRINLLLCVSTFIRSNVIETAPVPPDKVKVHFNGLDLERFHPDACQRHQFRRKYHIPDEASVVGFLGRFTPMKGHREFFEAGKILQKNHTEKKLIFLVAGGDSHGEEEFGNKTRMEGIRLLGEQNIIYTGNVENTPEVLCATDILVFPSHEESFGNVLCEAGALEIPVVASNSGGVPDIVLHGKTGLLVRPKNPQAFAEAISFYLLNPETAKQHGQNAREWVTEKFSIEKQISRLEQLYVEVVKEKNEDVDSRKNP
jgi:glycosyltransferase involved in cell wall biosynthesis